MFICKYNLQNKQFSMTEFMYAFQRVYIVWIILQSVNKDTINGFPFDLVAFLITVPELVIQEVNDNHFAGQVPRCIPWTAYCLANKRDGVCRESF